MTFQTGKTYHGFKLIEEREIKEIQSIGRLFQHENTGARLFHLANDDDNKVFTIGFRTPPTDSTGVPHIVEHCVLAGSRKYKTKEPFMDMIKGSLQTFINAFTYPDKTIYPVASRNDKDFKNLMDVYLDAVFFPAIYEKKDIFMQEGWHYEIFNKEDPIDYKGVVYNEMKGAYSSPETVVYDAIGEALYPDTTYRHSSGGNPKNIPDLSYEDFLNFHKKFYHPSNSYIYIYGDGDLDQQLSYIDQEYLSKFDYLEIDSHVDKQEPFSQKVYYQKEYNLADDEDEKGKTYLSLNFVTGESKNPVDNIMSAILSDMLLESSASPIKKAVMEAELGEDLFSMSAGGLEESIGFVLKNTDLDKKDEFQDIIYRELEKMVKEGINKKLIKASLNSVEYSLREAGGMATKGLIYIMNAYQSWLYDASPFDILEYDKVLEDLKLKLDTDYFERYIEERILNNPHAALVAVVPKKGLAKEENERVRKLLDDLKAELSDQEIEELIRENEALTEKQLTDDSLEDKLTLPRLSLDDIDSNVLEIDQDIIDRSSYKILHNKVFTSGISYIDFIFDSSIIEEEYIHYISLLGRLLGDVDTENYGYGDLDSEIYINTGGISFSASAHGHKSDPDIYFPKFALRARIKRENTGDFFDLLEEISFRSKFTDKKRIKELLQQLRSRIEMSIFQYGNSIVASRVASYYSPIMKYNEKTSGLDFYWFLSQISKNFDDKADEIIENLNYVYNKIFNINNLIVGFTGSKDDFDLFLEKTPGFLDKLSEDKLPSFDYSFREEAKNEAIKSASNVQYVAKGYNFKKLGYQYNGALNVLTTILNGEYLHNRVRAKGGAYGVGVSMGTSGNLNARSYRDPNLVKTLETYDGMAAYVDSMEISELDLTSFIIGALGAMDPALTPSAKGSIAINRYINGVTVEELRKIKEEALNTSLEELRTFAPILKDSMEKDFICVLGSEDTIEENKDIFNEIKSLNI